MFISTQFDYVVQADIINTCFKQVCHVVVTYSTNIKVSQEILIEANLIQLNF